MANLPLAPTRLVSLVEELQSRGQYTFTRQGLAGVDGRSALAFEAAVRRLKKQGRLASPRRGFFVIVPAEYRESGCLPPSWFIADLMAHLRQPYYVGLLSAAAIHGAAHQQPMVFQVVTDRPTREARAGRVRIQFHMSRRVEATSVVEIPTETGSMRVSSPEATAFDLVRFPSAAGHLSNVATVLRELAERLDGSVLTEIAPRYTVPDVQRLGYLLDLAGEEALAASLFEALEDRRLRPVRLAPSEDVEAQQPQGRWRIISNATVEADL